MNDNEALSTMLPPNALPIPLTRGYTAYVSPEDYDFVSQFKWTALVITRQDNAGLEKVYVYAYRAVTGDNKKKEYLGRVVLERKLDRALVEGETRKHVSGNTLDNTRSNVELKISKKLASLDV